MVPLAPVNEADRVAPVALTSLAEPVVTVAFAPPEVPPPDWFHSTYVIVILEIPGPYAAVVFEPMNLREPVPADGDVTEIV